MQKRYVIILVVLSLFNCETNTETTESNTIESTLIAKDNLYGGGAEGIAKQNLIISDASTWNNLIAQMDSVNKVSDEFSETDIDFSKFKIIGVFDEIKSSGGHAIDLNLTQNSNNVVVKITYTNPQGNATAVITQPFHIIKITNTQLRILFE